MAKRKTKKQDFDFLVMPAKLFSVPRISLIEKVILAEIGYFNGNGYPGYIEGNSVMAKKFGVGRKTIFRSIQRLKSFEMIKDVGVDEYHRCLKLNGKISSLFEQSVNNQKTTSNTYAESSEEFRLAELLFSEIQKRKLDFKKPNFQSWARDIDLMIHKDNRNPERIAEVIRWCQADSGNSSWQGWQNNILSAKKLRAKFDKLELSMGKENGNSSKNRGSNQPAEQYIR